MKQLVLFGKIILSIVTILIVICVKTISAHTNIMVIQTDCETGQNSFNLARDQLQRSPDSVTLANILEKLKYATEICRNNGDFWYYRAKVEEKLGISTYLYSLRKAQEFNSHVLKIQLNIWQTADKYGPKITVSTDTVVRGVNTKQTPNAIHTNNIKALKIEATITDDSQIKEVTLNGNIVELKRDKLEYIVDLGEGNNTFYLTAQDILGNRTVEKIQYTNVKSGSGTTLPGIANDSYLDGSYYALVISVEKYNNPKIQSLKNPRQDSEQLVQALTELYTFEKEKVHKLANPTRREIIAKFKELNDHIKPKDLLLVFYAGHGIYDETIKQGYWLPKDADPEIKSEWISNSDLRDMLNNCKANHILVISDSCFSGSLRLTEGLPRAYETIMSQKSRKLMSSGALKAVPDESVFIKYLVAELRRNKDNYLLAPNLYNKIRENVINNSPVDQTPLFGPIQSAGDEGGDFIFIKRL
jgi:hypothetical protein